MINTSFLIIFLLLFNKGYPSDFVHDQEFCPAPSHGQISNCQSKKYLLYDVNPGEGFNLRRDVYMRIATLVHKLNKESSAGNWTLVLPPWGPLYHWKSKHIGPQDQVKWSKFFDLPSLGRYVPVIEFENFVRENGPRIDLVYYLQHYAEGWVDGKWGERADIQDCVELPPYRKVKKGKFVSWFWGYDDVYAANFHCLSIEGYSSTLKSFILSSKFSAIMIDRAEVILHDAFGDANYWMIRHSMAFSKQLKAIGDDFRKVHLNSTDKADKTLEKEWNSSLNKRTAKGGPYIAVHLRRRDFAEARSSDVPSVKHAAKQILQKMKALGLEMVFVATDAIELEFYELQGYIPGIKHFKPTKDVHADILDGGVAIVDQWICAHSRFFIGTYESTFSFRIQEEREILGFPVETTFNRLCGDNQTSCKQSSRWTIAYK